MSAQSVSNVFPAGLTLAGGIPLKSQDFAASIIFTIAYAIILPVAIWRLVTPASRCLVLIRPAIFILIRVVTFALRAVMANGNYATGLFIAEQVLLLCGFVLLCEPLIELLGFHIARNRQPSPQRHNGLGRIVRLLQLALIAALVLGIYAGSQFASIGNNTNTLNTVKACRDANAIICLVITALACLVSLFAFFRHGLPALPTAHLVVLGALLTLASGYKTVLYLDSKHSPSLYHTGTKVAFYCLNSLPEYLAAVLYVVKNISEEFAITEAHEKERISKLMRDGKWDPQAAAMGGEQKYEMQPAQGAFNNV